MRNSSRRNIGEALRFSARMKAPSMTAATTNGTTTGAEPEPSVGPWMMP
jgi:hypothetical protein